MHTAFEVDEKVYRYLNDWSLTLLIPPIKLFD
jgi:hypothetical protein